MKDFENYDKYAKLTLSKDLSGICQLNGVDLDSFVELKKGIAVRAIPEYRSNLKGKIGH